MSRHVWKGAAASIAAGASVLALSGGVAAARPMCQMIPHHFTQQPSTAYCEANYSIACYSADQIRHAYGTDALGARGLDGRGTTIVLVDSFGSPTAQSDLNTFDEANHLPPPPSFSIIQPAGPVPPYDPTNTTVVGWAEETSLDIEYSHAMAPGAKILLVETPVAETEGVTGFPQIVQAENYVINHDLGDVISQSFAATEQTFPSPFALYQLRGAYENALLHHVTMLASTGDAGATDYELDGTTLFSHPVVAWPATDPLVTAVGGTMLSLDALGNRVAPDNVWDDQYGAGSGGLSVDFSRPSYQAGARSVVGNARGVPDVSMSAAVNGAANVYLGFTSAAAGITPGWYPFGGTSEASPLFSGEVAIADQIAHHPLGLLNPTLYALGDGAGSGLTDVTTGDNTFGGVTGFDAGPGYDLASGLGTANQMLPFQLASGG